MKDLPLEILAHIMNCMPYHELKSLALTCQQWYQCYLFRIKNNKVSSLIFPPFWKLRERNNNIELPYIPSSPLFEFNEEFSIEIRVRVFAPGPLLMRERNGFPPSTEIHLSRLYVGQERYSLKVIFKDRASFSLPRMFVVAYTVPSSEWCLISISFARPHLFIYTDGILVQSEVYDKNLAAVFTPFRIGGSSRMFPQEVNADLQELRFWDHGRTHEEVAEHHDKILSGKEKGLIAYYFCNGETVSDLTGKGHIAIVHGQIW